MEPSSFLFYGGPGGGKSALGVSAFWDIHKLEVVRKGLWLQIGQERNRALGVPAKYIQRFASSPENLLGWAEDLKQYLKQLRSAAAAGKGPEVVFIDGLTELAYLADYAYRQANPGADKWSPWRYQKELMQAIFQLADPIDLHAHVIVSCRVGEFKKGITNRDTGEVTGRDPSFFDTKHFPQMDGWSRLNTPAYFEYMFYVEQEAARPEEVHRCYLLETGEFKVKNANSHRWGKNPRHLDNPTFDDIVALIDGAAGGAPNQARVTQKIGGKGG